EAPANPTFHLVQPSQLPSPRPAGVPPPCADAPQPDHPTPYLGPLEPEPLFWNGIPSQPHQSNPFDILNRHFLSPPSLSTGGGGVPEPRQGGICSPSFPTATSSFLPSRLASTPGGKSGATARWCWFPTASFLHTQRAGASIPWWVVASWRCPPHPRLQSQARQHPKLPLVKMQNCYQSGFVVLGRAQPAARWSSPRRRMVAACAF
ncbi:unnamed protein product, partial [Urochloa humidicola]